MTLIDLALWQVVRMIYFVLFVLAMVLSEVISVMGVRLSIEQSAEFTGWVLSSKMIYESPKPDAMPKPVSDKLLMWAKILVVFVIIGQIRNLVKALL